MSYFSRQYELSVGSGGLIDTFSSTYVEGRQPAQIAFQVDTYPNSAMQIAQISIWGLKPETRERMSQEFQNVTLRAGWPGDMGTIFQGLIRNVSVSREGPDMVVKMYCQSVQAYDTAFINKSWGAGTPVRQVINDTADTFGLPVVFYGDFERLGSVVKGRTITSGTAATMADLARTYGFEYVLGMGRCAVYMPDDGIVPGDPIVYNTHTGLVGTPVLTELGADLTVMLNPQILPYAQIDMQNITGSFDYGGIFYQTARKGSGRGLFTVLSYSHLGDFYGKGASWVTQIRGIRVGQTRQQVTG